MMLAGSHRKRLCARTAFALASCVAMVSCGEFEKGPQQPVDTAPPAQGGPASGAKGDPAAESATRLDAKASPVPTKASGTVDSESYADLSTTLVEKVGLSPVAYFETTSSGVIRPCMGVYIGRGRFVTAAHCFSGFEGDRCPSNLRIRWVRFDQGAWEASGDATACESFRKRTGSDASGADVAVVGLSSRGTWPGEGMRFESPEPHANKNAWMLGPQAAGSPPTLRTRMGKIYELKATYFLFNAAPTAGFSGTPVFRAAESGTLSLSADSRALGLYMGSSDGGSRVLRSEVVSDFLESDALLR